MKKVIFICLLSLTTCLSRPDGTPGAAVPLVPGSAPAAAAAAAPAPPAAAAAPAPAEASPAKEQAQNATLTPTPSLPPAAAPPAPAAPAAPAPAAPAAPAEPTPAAPAVHTDATNDNATKQNKTTDKDLAPVTPNATKTETTPAAPEKTDANKAPADKKPTDPSVPEDKKKNETVPVTTATPAKAVEAAGRGFDGPSFLGGMILTLGLLAVGFMGFKYYRNQTERNYHTL